MAEYIISTDTSCDFPLEYVKQHQLPLVTLFYSIDGVTGENGCPSSDVLKNFYDKMRAGSMTKTQQASIEDTEKVFREILQEGKDILHIAFSSGLSGTANAARLAAENMMEEFPERKIIVIDSLCASLGQGLLVDYALKLQQQGKTMEETAKWLEDHIQNICHLFTVEDLKYLQRGGRISKTTALVGTMIGIKPVLHVDPEGKLVSISKVRGRKQSIQALVNKMEENIGKYRGEKQPIFISHGDCIEDANYLAELVKERFGYDEFLINDVGPTIGAHSGPGTLALFFMGETR
ncbi:DegV family protein [Negativibacillus massiliensis]|uniref:DegV family protein n=1 Tax=Negativibacillus massiliensis TaxID=1871035 RepID=UPI0023F7A415|nr:DegV family protein [Negativibacillus massiliensis]MDY4046619.1 DegV family protein [Negativibacillus massiliensis]